VDRHSGLLIAGNVVAAGTSQRERKGCSWTNTGYGPLKSGMYTVDCLLSPYHIEFKDLLHCVGSACEISVTLLPYSTYQLFPVQCVLSVELGSKAID